LLAAVTVAARHRDLAAVFGRWRTGAGWILLALLAPAAIHVLATALYALAGGEPTRWLHPPTAPEQIAALVVFPLGEEFGWRGFAHPRMVARYGLARGALLLGVVWALWHLVYWVTPTAAGFDLQAAAITVAELPLYSVLIGWVFERAKSSMAVAIAFHAGAHLDHFEAATDIRPALHLTHLLVVGLLAALAIRSSTRKRVQGVSSA
jgi:membrane protease YdiL (CAAX protease family)